MTIEIIEFIQSFDQIFFQHFFSFISFLGEEYVIIFILGLLYWTIDKQSGEIVGITLGLSTITNNIIKEIVGAKRPFERYPERVNNLRDSTATGKSFPSGHTQNFTSILVSITKKYPTKKLIYTSSILIILMMISRMYLGVHFLEDVVAAVLIGILIASMVSYVYQTYQSNVKVLHRIYYAVLLMTLPFVFVLQDEDFFKGYGLFAGIVFAVIFEKHVVKFTLDVSKTKKIIRLTLGLVIILAVQMGLGFVMDSLSITETSIINLLYIVKYCLIPFIGFGLYPMLFRKFHF